MKIDILLTYYQSFNENIKNILCLYLIFELINFRAGNGSALATVNSSYAWI